MTSKQRDELLMAIAATLLYENRPLMLSPMGQKSIDDLRKVVGDIKADSPRRDSSS